MQLLASAAACLGQLQELRGVLFRVAFMEGNGFVMLGKVTCCERTDDAGGVGRKKKRAAVVFVHLGDGGYN